MGDLDRFRAAQAETLETALAELRAGRKTSHWMWWIFPQLASLGRSPTAKYYGIEDLEEARDYLADPGLRAALLAAAEAVLSHPDRSAEAIMGPVDALKLRSSATLFLEAGGGSEELRSDLRSILDRFYGGDPCERTRAALGGE